MQTDSAITTEKRGEITVLKIDNRFATATVSLFGGQVLSFIPKSDNQERLWLSPHAFMDGKKPIRGGIPLCWPWFSDSHGKAKGELPSHGFLRTQQWSLAASEEHEGGTRLELRPAYCRANGFEHDCDVVLILDVGESLTVTLSTTNNADKPVTFTGALHTYFYVPDIHNVTLTGLSSSYLDKTQDYASTLSPEVYKLRNETDRIHHQGDSDTLIKVDENTFTRVGHRNNDSVVVWNPWQSAAFISDMDAFSFNHMICVETATTKGKTLAAGERHDLTQIISA